MVRLLTAAPLELEDELEELELEELLLDDELEELLLDELELEDELLLVELLPLSLPQAASSSAKLHIRTDFCMEPPGVH